VSIEVMDEVWWSSAAKGSDLLVLLAMADNADSTSRECWPSIAYLAQKTRLSERGVRYVIRRLEKLGAIVLISDGTGRKSNTWRIEPVRQTLPVSEDGANRQDSVRKPAVASAPEPSVEPSVATVAIAPVSAKRAPDVIWDALEAELGRPATRNERGKRNNAVKQLRDVAASPDQVRDRCAEYRRRWPNASLTDQALVNHWTSLATEFDPHRVRNVTAADILRGGSAA
jgi:hypothetical protein